MDVCEPHSSTKTRRSGSICSASCGQRVLSAARLARKPGVAFFECKPQPLKDACTPGPLAAWVRRRRRSADVARVVAPYGRLRDARDRRNILPLIMPRSTTASTFTPRSFKYGFMPGVSHCDQSPCKPLSVKNGGATNARGASAHLRNRREHGWQTAAKSTETRV